jgi:hypothetical protein
MVGVAGVSAVGLILGFGVTATRRFRSQLPVISAATVAGFAVAVLLVPMRALFGAAFALLASAVVLILGNGAILAMAERRVRDGKCEVVRSSTRVQAEHEVALATILEKN